MSEKKFVIDWKNISVFLASSATAGDLIYRTTGSGVAGLTAGEFYGIADETGSAATKITVENRGVFNITKGNGTGEKIEQGQILYGSGATSVSTAQVQTGSVIGVAWEQSSSDTDQVAVSIRGFNNILM